MATANIQGFIDAQASLRTMFGAAVTFKVPVTKTWPEGTKINPDTNLPYDSTIQETSAEFTDVVKTCLIIAKQGSPLRPQADTRTTAAGDLSGMDIILDIAEADKEDVNEAVEMIVNTLTYRIEEMKPFSIAGEGYRWLVYGMEL